MRRFLTSVSALCAMALASIAHAADDGSTPPDMSKPVQVFILMGQSNMVGLGKVAAGGKGGAEGSLEKAVKQDKKYPYLVDAQGNWATRNDVRYVRVMSGKGPGGGSRFTIVTRGSGSPNSPASSQKYGMPPRSSTRVHALMPHCS